MAAALLFADISGFTALTEELAGSGRKGAEEVARIISRAFRPAIRAICGEGGSILSFGGDALFAMFLGTGSVARAEAAAVAIGDVFERPLGIAGRPAPVGLSVSQAIHYGKVIELHLRFGERRHYLVAGPSVRALARLEMRSRAGEILVLDPKAVRLNNNLAVRALFSALARTRPLVLVLEDLHWADGASIDVLAWLAKIVAKLPVVLLLLYRPGYQPPEEATALHLTELSRAAADSLLAAHLGRVPGGVADLLKERAGGNPFYIEELARHFLETGLLRSTRAGYELTREIRPDDLPPGIERLIAARLDRLSPAARDVAQHAAVIGRSFLLSLLKRLKAVARSADRGVAELLAREIVFRKAEAPGEFIFKHALTRDVAYAGILVSYRRRLHRAVAEALEEASADDRENFLAMLGHHWEYAERRKRARDYYLAGARGAARRYAHEEAEAGYRAYLRLVERHTGHTIEVRNELGEGVLQRCGRMDAARQEHQRALAEAVERKRDDLRAESLRNLGTIALDTGRLDEAGSYLGQASEAFRRCGDRRGEGMILGSLADLHLEQGHMDEARNLYLRSLEYYQEVGDRRLQAMAFSNLAVLHYRQGLMTEASHLLRRALTMHREIGNRPSVGTVLANLANVEGDLGHRDEARRLNEQALAVFREVGHRRFEGRVLGNLGIQEAERGRFAKARDCYVCALGILREVGDRLSEGIFVGNMADVDRREGRLKAARDGYEQALAINREVGNRRCEGIVLGSLATLLWDEGRLEEACAIYDQAIHLLREVGDRSSEGVVLNNLGRLHAEQGHMKAASVCLQRALAIFRAVKDRQSEGIALGSMASWLLLAEGDQRKAKRLAVNGEKRLRQLGADSDLAVLLCLRGHIALACKRSARDILSEVEALAKRLATRAGSEVGRALVKLRRAVAASEDRPLVCGYLPEDLTAAQLGWLADHRPEVMPGK